MASEYNLSRDVVPILQDSQDRLQHRPDLEEFIQQPKI